MAAPNQGQTIAHAWEKYVGTRPEDNVFDDYWLFDRLSKGKSFRSFDGGRDIRATLEYAVNSTVASYTDTETFSVSRIDVFDESQWAWKEYIGHFLLSELEKALNQGSGGKFPLRSAKLSNLHSSYHKKLNEDFFSDGTGNSSKDVGGFQHIISTTPTTGTVGGINRANFTFHRNQQASGAKTATAFDNLRSTMRTEYNDCSNGIAQNHPDWSVTTQTVFEGYESLLIPGERYTNKNKGDAGFKNDVLTFKGMQMAYDEDCPSGNMYLVNSDHLGLAYQKGYWMKALEAVRPANQTVNVFQVMTICNLFTDNARRLGVISSIT